MTDDRDLVEFLDEPTQHLFVASPRDPLSCFACGHVEDHHAISLEELERRVAETRYRRPEGAA